MRTLNSRVFSLFCILFCIILILVKPLSILAVDETAQETIPSNQPINQQTNTQTPHPQRVVIINQLRGGECCEPGSLETLKLFIGNLQQRKLSATFTLRYDALTDERFLSELKKLPTNQATNKRINQPQPKADPPLGRTSPPLAETNKLINQPTYELGLFLEITPELARRAGVQYRGTLEKWYEAQYVYLIGYTWEERKKILDTLFLTFEREFGYFPTTTTGWITDTQSLNYIRETYGTTVHQITREQWGTDSYTLSGGPVHYPYYARENWAFLPTAPQSTNQLINEPTSKPLNELTNQPSNQLTLILRQTISDPLRNYGDTSSAFTSQPNDYFIDGKTTDYFQGLLRQALDQPANPYSFALIGLENSMRDEVNQEFLKQLDVVEKLRAERPHMEVVTANSFSQEFPQLQAPTALTTLVGKDLVTQQDTSAIWINSPQYRVRILEKNNQLQMTDFRLYGTINTEAAALSDPYAARVAGSHGHWVAPFVLDGSRFYSPAETPPLSLPQQLKEVIKQRILPEYTYRELVLPVSQNDLQTQPHHLSLPAKNDESYSLSRSEDEETITLSYLDPDNQPVEIRFTTDTIVVSGKHVESTLEFVQHSDNASFLKVQKQGKSHILSWLSSESENYPLFSLTRDCESSDQCVLRPFLSDILNWPQTLAEFSPYLFPDITVQKFSADNSVAYAHNQVAIAGQQPIRMVVLPRDEYGYPVRIPENITVQTTPVAAEVVSIPQQGTLGTKMYDIVENRVGKYQVEIKVGDTLLSNQDVFVIPDCRDQVGECLKNPVYLWKYMQFQFITRLRQI